MTLEWSPIRWPATWRDPALLALLKDLPINCLLIESSEGLSPVLDKAGQQGLKIVKEGSIPARVKVLQGQWPGVKLNESGAVDRASAGPTGAPWVDSNGWAILLEVALNPGIEVWVSATPLSPRLFSESYVIGVADAAVHGGSWIISLDPGVAAGIAGHNADALATWKKLADAVRFFASHRAWTNYAPEAVLGVISDFSRKNEFMSHELLNLLARANQQYRVIPKREFSTSSLKGLRAVLYTDEEAPEPDIRGLILSFVRQGGTLVTGPRWGRLPSTLAPDHQHPRYAVHRLGKGRVALAQPDFEDPYVVANDAVVLMSHRYELLRFWNVGALGSFFTMDARRTHGVVQLLFYASARFGNATLRIPYRCRAARLWILDRSDYSEVDMELKKDGTEFHLPPVFHYAAIELEL